MEVFFFNDTAATEICTLSLHDALPISDQAQHETAHHRWAHHDQQDSRLVSRAAPTPHNSHPDHRSFTEDQALAKTPRSEEHTSELQSRQYLVCCLLLEKMIILAAYLLL